MVFPDRFRNHLIADQLHILNVCFLTPEMRREYGGTAGNVGYNLRLLGEDPLVMAAVGEDIAPYLERFDKLGLDSRLLRRIPGQFTAQAFITTDLDDNQITAFHPGAMMRSFENHVRDVGEATFGIVAPDGREAMLQHVDEFSERKIPFIFDPGQAMPLFSGEEFRAFIDKADYVTVNDYESMLLQRNTGWSTEEITARVKAYIVTRGPKGSLIHTQKETFDIPPAHERRVSDPTGCGDAYRAGLIFAIMRDMDWPTVGRVASLMGALKVEHPGTQNQRFTYDEFADQFRQQFGYALD
jgi:adenosine kinase